MSGLMRVSIFSFFAQSPLSHFDIPLPRVHNPIPPKERYLTVRSTFCARIRENRRRRSRIY
jgi:hypothetical protein